MSSSTINLLSVLLLALVVIAPLTVYAQAPPEPSTGFINPLGDSGVGTAQELLTRIIGWIAGISALVALLAIVWGGMLYIISFNNDQYLTQAKGIIKWAVIGLAIIILSFVIIATVARFLGAYTDG